MRRLASLLALLIGLPAAAAAETDAQRLFTVHGIDIDVRAQTASAARELALSAAQRQGFLRLVEKIVAADDIADVSEPPPAALDRMVRGLDIRDERSSATRYLATVDVSFWPSRVRSLLDAAGVAFTESPGGPYLLLPVLTEGGQSRLFGDHGWRQAFIEADLKNRLVLYEFPPDSLFARSLLTPRRVLVADAAALGRIAERFALPQVLVAQARPGMNFATGTPAVRYLYRSGPAGAAAGEGSLQAEQGERAEQGAQAEQGERAFDLMVRAAEDILEAIDAAWKERTLVRERDEQELKVAAPVRGLEDWLAVRRRLAGVSLVRAAEIETIALPVSRFELRYVGSLEQVELALAQARLHLARTDAGYVLQPAELADEQARTRLPPPPEETSDNASDNASDEAADMAPDMTADMAPDMAADMAAADGQGPADREDPEERTRR